MLDIHAHLFWDSYDNDRDDVIRRAREVGVEQMICVGTSPADNPQAIAMAEQYDGVYASVGLHPHFFNEIEKEIPNQKSQIPNKSQFSNHKIKNVIEELRAIAKHQNVIAIGECGLDYFVRDKQPTVNSQQKAIQREGFLKQLEIARELGLPLIIHTRPSLGTSDAYEDVFTTLKEAHEANSSALKAVLHCYMGDTEMTEKFLTLPNVYFSFAGNITYPVTALLIGTKNDPAETIKMIPLDRIFVETDCPFLAPQTKRGARNEPAYVEMTVEKICAVAGVGKMVLEKHLDENFKRVFSRCKV